MKYQRKIKIAKELQLPEMAPILGEILRERIVEIIHELPSDYCLGGIQCTISKHNNFVFDDMPKNTRGEAQKIKDSGVFEYVIAIQKSEKH